MHTGKFEQEHLCDFCKRYIGAKELSEKTVKICSSNGYAHLESQDLQLPIISIIDPNDSGSILYHYMQKVLLD